MSRLINDLLAYTTARDAPLSLQPVDLHAVAAQIIWQRTNHLRGAGTPMPDISLGPLPSVTADPSMIRHLLDNLIGNGLKYVPTGESAHLDITADRRPDGWTDVEVADRGIGIPDAAKPYVFDTFYRANHDTDHPGTGLGLAICRRIVDRHGGTIGVTDNPGGGTRFRFALPPVDRTIHPRRENGTTLEPLARV
jgi:signal transduction histidine kinase